MYDCKGIKHYLLVTLYDSVSSIYASRGRLRLIIFVIILFVVVSGSGGGPLFREKKTIPCVLSLVACKCARVQWKALFKP